MTERHLVLSTCGTSLLSNLADGDVRKLVVEHANTVDLESIPIADRGRIQDLITFARTELVSSGDQRRAQLSAKLNGLSLLAGEQKNKIRLRHWEISTDTWLGQEAADCIGDTLSQQGHQVDIRRVPGLRTNDRGGSRSSVGTCPTLCPGSQGRA